MTAFRRAIASSAFLVLTAFGTGAHAQDAAPTTPAAPAAPAKPATEASRLFDEGVALLERQEYAEACPKLAESQRLAPAGGTVLNLAYCYEHVGKLASAYHAYGTAAEIALAQQRPERAEQAKKKRAELEPKLARARLVAPPALSALRDVRVELDGAVLDPSRMSEPVPIDRGAHEVRVSALLRQPAVQRLFAESDGVTVSLELSVPEPLAAQATAAQATAAPAGKTKGPADRAPRESTSAAPFVALTVGGSALLGFGLVAGGIAINEHSTSNAECARGCTPAGVEAEDSARTWARISTVSVIGGVVVIGLGVALWIAAGSASPRARATAQSRVLAPVLRF